MKPGINRSRPPNKTQTPSISASPGGYPDLICSCIFLSTPMPCCFAKKAPRIPVAIIRAIVVKPPMVLPAKMNRPISKAGTTMNRKSKNLKFCHFPNGLYSIISQVLIEHSHDHCTLLRGYHRRLFPAHHGKCSLHCPLQL